MATIPLLGYIRDIPPERPVTRRARRARVAERRSGPIVLCHRGAPAFAPENTLEAYAAAMDYGADGCEIDIRRTADGVLVLYHDDMLDRLTEGFGTVNQLTYYQLLSLNPRALYGTATPHTRPPTFASLLVLARRRAMLLHLDIKEPGLEDDIRALLDAADAWDHVVAVNDYNSERLRQDPRLRLLRFKAPGLFEGRRDLDPQAVQDALAQPGEMIILDDPRLAARALGRPPYRPEPLPVGLREQWEPHAARLSDDPHTLIPPVYLQSLQEQVNPDSPLELLLLLDLSDLEERRRPDGDEAYQRRRTERILARAWAAQRLGRIAPKTGILVRRLVAQVRYRSLHPEWMYHGLDGAMAARALGMLGAVEAAPALVQAFRRIDPELETVRSPQFAQYPLAWTDFRLKMHLLPALGDLRCAASKKFLQEYLTMEEEAARQFAPPMFEEAGQALLRQSLEQQELEALLRNQHSEARAAAILECLDRPTPGRTAALAAVHPWALDLPPAQAAALLKGP